MYHHYFLLLNQTYVLGNVVSCLWLLVVHVSMLFLFFTTDIYTFIYLTLFLKGFFT